jgi:hypothetical protein
MSEINRPDPALKSVELFRGLGAIANMEAATVCALLDCAGIAYDLSGGAEMPNLPVRIEVASCDFTAAADAIRAAREAGPQAAEEAELESERAGEMGA